MSPSRLPWSPAIVFSSSFSRWMLSYSAFAYTTAGGINGAPACGGGVKASGYARIFSFGR